MMIVLMLALNAAGFFAIALSNDRYRRMLMTRHLSRRGIRVTRIAGVALLVAAWAGCTAVAGIATGLMLFVGMSTIGAGSSVLAITARRSALETGRR